MRKTILFITSLLLIVGCVSFQYKVTEDLDPYTKTNLISESWNRTHGISGSIELNFIYEKNLDLKYLSFHYRDIDWLFIGPKDSFMFLFSDDGVLTLSPSTDVSTNVSSGGGVVMVEEWGLIKLGEEELDQLLKKTIIGLRVNGKDFYREYNTEFPAIQARWRAFSTKYFSG